MEYDPLPNRLRHKFDFSVNIKTVSAEGIVLYVHDQKHIDFIALYLKDGIVSEVILGLLSLELPVWLAFQDTFCLKFNRLKFNLN